MEETITSNTSPKQVQSAEIELIKREEELKKKITHFFDNKDRLMLLAIMLFSLSVLLYYFSLTKNQPLWWDEAEYMSQAKHFAFGIKYEVNPQRPFLFPVIAAFLYKIGFGEIALRIFLVLIPAWLTVLVTFLLIKEAYGAKTGAVAALITSVSWIHLFYTMRLMTDSIGLFFGVMSFYCFWKGYINKGKRIYTFLIGFFVILSFLIRLTGILYGLVIFVFLIITDKFRFLKSKDMWLSVIIAIITLLPLFLYNYSFFKDPLAFKSGYGGTQNLPLGWDLVNLVYDYPQRIFFLTFLLGLVFVIPTFLSFDLVLKRNDKKGFADLFMAVTILTTLIFFITMVRQAENRWLIAMSIGIFAISAKGILFIFEKIKNYHQAAAVLGVIALLIGGAYYELKQANIIINIKKNSYQEIRDAGLWLKENSNKEDIVLSQSLPQMIYYAEREVAFAPREESEFPAFLKEKKPRFLMISLIEPHHPSWLLQQTRSQDGSTGIFIPYFNSSIIISQNQITSFDLKPTVEKDGARFTYIYPQNTLNGVFLYKIDYL